ncbi:hypothetical protein [Dyadobacter fermentans]|uniref:hypothetical protein n=1 Tax=Dyadobacter fermentans TaxID=94254 RepID=UPI001CBFA973|nr:hypothetical protein [Dyadobacter fermentans]MBZ1362879.1 hypothetical protein [Dyadobacter fermentans]
MENLELKKPFQSIKNHFENVDAKIQQQTSTGITSPVGLITARPHHLRRMKSHQEKLRENPVSASGAAHERAQLFSNKTHYDPRNPDAQR